MNLTWLKVKGNVKGIFSSPIPYTPLLEDGDSSPYFGTYEGQRYGAFDTNDCWDFSACEIFETRLTMLEKLGLIPQDTLDWAKANGYKDTDGDWYISRRWVAILSGVRDDGNSQLSFWKIASVAGLVPDSLLPYSIAESSKWITKDQFNNDYFNPKVITPQMRQLGLDFLKRFTIQAENISPTLENLETYLKEGSMQIGHAVPQDGTWNRQFVNYPVGRSIADHATELYKIDVTQAYPFYDYDSYEPHLKQLSKNYRIIFLTRVSIKPIPVSDPVPLPQFSVWMKLWFNFVAWQKGQPLPFPNVLLG